MAVDKTDVTRAVPRIVDQGVLNNKEPLLPAEDQLDTLLKDRGTKYGSFDNHARLTCSLQDVFYAHMLSYNRKAYEELTDSQKEALHMIFHKLGRIGNGDPNYADSWVDIAGYAKLAADDIQREHDFNDPKAPDPQDEKATIEYRDRHGF